MTSIGWAEAGSLSSTAHRAAGRPAQLPELLLVRVELRPGRQTLVDQQVGDLLELGDVGEVEDVVAPVVQVVARAPDGADRRCSRTGVPDSVTDFLTPGMACAVVHAIRHVSAPRS